MSDCRRIQDRRTSMEPRRVAINCGPEPERLDALLDEALQLPFPASDAIAVCLERCAPRPTDAEAGQQPPA